MNTVAVPRTFGRFSPFLLAFVALPGCSKSYPDATKDWNSAPKTVVTETVDGYTFSASIPSGLTKKPDADPHSVAYQSENGRLSIEFNVSEFGTQESTIDARFKTIQFTPITNRKLGGLAKTPDFIKSGKSADDSHMEAVSFFSSPTKGVSCFAELHNRGKAIPEADKRVKFLEETCLSVKLDNHAAKGR